MGATASSSEPRAAPLQFVQSISLPDVQGRIDHFNVDLKRRRLFIAALGNHTVEVVKQRSLHQPFEQGRFGELMLLSDCAQPSLRQRSDATLDARVRRHVANRLTQAAARLSRTEHQLAQTRM
jgi:hypothetical protein